VDSEVDSEPPSESTSEEEGEVVADHGTSTPSTPRASTQTKYVKVSACGKEYMVPVGRANKAKKHLTDADVRRVLQPKQCRCKRPCYAQFSLSDILEARAELYTQTNSESQATEWLANQLRQYGNASPSPQGTSLVHKVNGVQVCAAFWRRVFALGECKHTAARYMVYQGTVFWESGVKREPKPKSDTQYQIAYGFWKHFFENMCQTPHPGLRLFPHNLTYDVIFREFYPMYVATITANAGRVPPKKMSKSSFWRARWDPAFADVKRRVKHRHCQCPTCLNLTEVGKAGFKTEYDRAHYLERRRLHNRSVEHFRKLEIDLQQRAAHSPDQTLVLFYDDTS
jgi:hypothetical protein